MALKIPRLGKNAHGVYYFRLLFWDENGRRHIKQESLHTKNAVLARTLALKLNFLLENKVLMASNSSKPPVGLFNALTITAFDGEKIDFDAGHAVETDYAVYSSEGCHLFHSKVGAHSSGK
jgi:hypothetical protein